MIELFTTEEVARIAALSYAVVAQYGSHAALKAGWPALFNRLAETFPAVRTLT